MGQIWAAIFTPMHGFWSGFYVGAKLGTIIGWILAVVFIAAYKVF